jgi:hypothetical protein
MPESKSQALQQHAAGNSKQQQQNQPITESALLRPADNCDQLFTPSALRLH